MSDLTYIRTGEGWSSLTAVLDLADREVVGWALSEAMVAEATTVAAWQMALRNRPLFHSLLFHSDRGVQDACSAFEEDDENRNGLPPQVCHQAGGPVAVFEYIESFYNRNSTLPVPCMAYSTLKRSLG